VKPVLWQANHSSQVKSVTTGALPASPARAAVPVLLTGSQFTSDEDVEAIHARTGELFWGSTALEQWTYGVALQPVVSAPAPAAPPSVYSTEQLQRGVAAFGCPFSAHAKGTPPPPPCELGFWQDAGGSSSAPNWKMVIPNSTQNAGHGPPEVVFSGDGRSLIIKYHGDASFDGQDLEYLGVVSVAGPTATPMATQLLDWGYGHSLTVLRPPATAGPPAAAKPSPTLALVTRSVVTTGTINEHFPMHYGLDPGSPIVIADKPLIDCNRTADCRIMTTSEDLSQIVVSVVPIVDNSSTLCPFEPDNPYRWGVALLVADGPDSRAQTSGGGDWPYSGYSVAWVKCGADDVTTPRKLASVRSLAQPDSLSFVLLHLLLTQRLVR
jgi:hypothetical protein